MRYERFLQMLKPSNLVESAEKLEHAIVSSETKAIMLRDRLIQQRLASCFVPSQISHCLTVQILELLCGDTMHPQLLNFVILAVCLSYIDSTVTCP